MPLGIWPDTNFLLKASWHGHPGSGTALANGASLRVPLLVHPHGVSQQGTGPLHLCTRYPLATTEAALELVFGGVPDRHPELAGLEMATIQIASTK